MDDSFTLDQALTAQRALREALALPPEQFPLPAFVGMISDEIEQLRAIGKSDDDIITMIERASGKSISAEDLARHYATPEERGARGHGD